MMVTKLYNKDIFNRRKEMKRWKLWYKEQFGGHSDIPFEPPKHFSCRCQYKNTHIQRDKIRQLRLNPFSDYNIQKQYIDAIRKGQKTLVAIQLKPITNLYLQNIIKPEFWDTYTPVHYESKPHTER